MKKGKIEVKKQREKVKNGDNELVFVSGCSYTGQKEKRLSLAELSHNKKTSFDKLESLQSVAC